MCGSACRNERIQNIKLNICGTSGRHVSGHRFNQLLVAGLKPRPGIRQVSWLMAVHTDRPSRFQWPSRSFIWQDFLLHGSNHSDEFVQESHLLPYSPDRMASGT